MDRPAWPQRLEPGPIVRPARRLASLLRTLVVMLIIAAVAFATWYFVIRSTGRPLGSYDLPGYDQGAIA